MGDTWGRSGIERCRSGPVLLVWCGSSPDVEPRLPPETETSAESTPSAPALAEVLFYHLEQKTLDEALPTLVEKSLERGWRTVIQAGHAERLDAIDQFLWTFRDDSFIPHGTAKAGNAALQPVFLTTGNDNPNGATVRFLVDGAVLEPLATQLRAYSRIVLMFHGLDAHELELARATWKAVKAAGAAATYWQQTDSGGWAKKA